MSITSTPASTKPVATEDPGKLSKTIGYFLSFIALGLVMTALGPTLPDLAAQTQTSIAQISLLFTARSVGYLLGALVGGRLYDRIGGHPVLVAVLGIMMVTMFLVPLTPLFWLLVLVLVIMGMAQGTVDVGGNTLLVWVHKEKVGPYMNAMHFFFGVGAFLAPVIIAQAMVMTGTIAWGYWTLALLMVPIAIYVLRLPSPTIESISPVESHRPVNYRLVILIAVFFFLYVGMEAGFGGWLFTYAVTLELSGETMARYLTAGFWGALTAGRLLAVPVATRLRPKTMLRGGLIGSFMSLSILLLWPASVTVLWIGSLGFGLSLAPIFPTTLSLAERYLNVSGKITGWFFVGASSGAMTIPWFIGQLFERIGPHVTLWIILADLLLAVAVFVALITWTGRSQLKGTSLG